MSGCQYNLYNIEDLSTEFYDFLHLEIVNIYSIIKFSAANMTVKVYSVSFILFHAYHPLFYITCKYNYIDAYCINIYNYKRYSLIVLHTTSQFINVCVWLGVIFIIFEILLLTSKCGWLYSMNCEYYKLPIYHDIYKYIYIRYIIVLHFSFG